MEQAPEAAAAVTAAHLAMCLQVHCIALTLHWDKARLESCFVQGTTSEYGTFLPWQAGSIDVSFREQNGR